MQFVQIFHALRLVLSHFTQLTNVSDGHLPKTYTKTSSLRFFSPSIRRRYLSKTLDTRYQPVGPGGPKRFGRAEKMRPRDYASASLKNNVALYFCLNFADTNFRHWPSVVNIFVLTDEWVTFSVAYETDLY